MGIKSISLAISALVLSTSVNASIFNTLNGVDYEWLELTATAGMSRDQVEAGILTATEGDTLYGYEYASRQMVEDLFQSYTTFDGLHGWHGDAGVLDGVSAILSDFGTTYSGTPVYYTNYQLQMVDTQEWVTYTDQHNAKAGGMFGLTGECGDETSCFSHQQMYYNADDVGVMAYQGINSGWDSTSSSILRIGDPQWGSDIGSYLVHTQVVPVPAAAWLFGSGLVGLIGVARRKKA